MMCDLTHGTKETRQGTMSLVQVHVDMFTTTQKPNKSVELCYKIFCARRDTVNAHGGDAGYRVKLYEKALITVMVRRGRDTTWMRNAYADDVDFVEKKAIEAQAKKVCCDQFLAALFIKMSGHARFYVLKDKSNNDFLFGDDKAPMTIVDAKRVLADFSVTTTPQKPVKAVETEGTGLTFAELSAEGKKTIQYFVCGLKGHYLNDCTKTSAAKKAEILASVKTGDFKTNKGVVQLNAGKGSGEVVKPPEDNDVESFTDFVGEQHMNVGGIVGEFEDINPFSFFGRNFNEFGKKSPPD